MNASDSARKIAEAISVRDSSLSQIQPPLSVPGSVPKNVLGVAKDVLSAEEIEITSYDVAELLKAIREKVFTCEQVTRAFLRRAALAQYMTNCITELLPERAIQRARYLDTLEHPIGPFHGLPISIKEHHGMSGCTTNGGYVAFIGQEQVTECAVNEVLYQAGAVFYARTTQPQAVMHLETSTNIYGVTNNPYNTDLTSGGSSGGESALIGFRGSILGVGGDIGGSIRCPAANCGIYGFKPTPYRMAKQGSKVAFGGQEGVNPTQGPMSTSREGLRLFMETYLSYEPWIKDDYLVPIPWRKVTLPKRLKIAVMWSDGIVTPHPPVTRALKEVVEKLKESGIEVVDWIPEGHDECWDITQALYWEDGGKNVEDTIHAGGEELLPLTKWLMKDNKNVKYRTAEEVCKLKVKRNEYRLRYNKLWLKSGEQDGHSVDAILCPAGPGAAPPHGNAKYWSYTSQWNILEYPGAVFPVTTVDQKIDLKDTDFKPTNEQDQFNYDLYEPEKYVDAPIGLQIVTRRFEDEKCLAVLEEVEKAMGRL
ncbi:acetamidase [Phlyctema vagabunda]|uniref:amidase n=1 Tax=Phlyctema vagabunda TaxID=108571 RepID=A0ABR4PQ60_9HELO